MKVALGIAVCGLFLVAAIGPASAQGAFSDVPRDHWAYDAVQELAEGGIVIGYPDGTFKGNRQLTRYEFAMALSRVMEKQGVVGPPGAKGEQGEQGPPGAPGPGGAALTERQKQLLDQLATEFGPELSQIRNDLEALSFRVDDLEAVMRVGPKAPKLSVTGMLDYRTGWYGSKLKPTGGDTNAFPGFPGLAKDAFKASSFTTMLTKVDLAGQINDNLAVNVSLVAEPRTNVPFEISGISPDIGIMDTVYFKEAWAKFDTKVIAPVTWKVGKQYFWANEGLVLDNELFVLKAIDMGVNLGCDVMLNGIYGQFDREAFDFDTVVPPSLVSNEGQDIYGAATLTVPVSDWKLTGVYVSSGIHSQRAWSVGVKGKLLSREIMGEFAQALKDSGNHDINDADKAWVVGANLIDTKTLTLGAKYGQLDEQFIDGSTLSALVPYAAISPHDIDWVDRPLFLDHDNIARGWEVCLAYKGLMGGTMPIKVRYYDGDMFDGATPALDDYTDGDAVWTVSISKELAQDITGTLLYGRRDTEATTGVSGSDPVQVVRGELAVKF